MNPAITISNYEEFFLLYVDGELSAGERLAVEQFVQGHPHLAEELDILNQAKLPVEAWAFEGKELLLKPEGAEISLDNYETHFLLDIDNELDRSGKATVEKFVLQHPALQEEFMLLKKTKLEPESIVFPAKETLYRKEEKERRVVYMSWQRLSIAAAFIGVVALLWTLVPSGSIDPVNPTVLTKPVTGKASNKEHIATENTPVIQLPEKAITGQQPVKRGINNIQQKEQDIPVNTIAQATVSNKMVTEPQPKELTARTVPQPTVVIPAQSINTGSIVNPPAEKNNIVAVEMNGNTAKTGTVTAKNAEPENSAGSIIQPAVYKELDTETEDSRKTLYVGSIEINKDKLRGFFRKATSLFRGKAKQQEEERTENAPSSSNSRSLR